MRITATSILFSSLAAFTYSMVDVAAATAQTRAESCVLQSTKMEEVSNCVEYYETVLLPWRAVNGSDEMKAERQQRCYAPIPREQRSRHAKQILECGDNVFDEYLSRQKPVRAISEQFNSGTCSAIWYAMRVADEDLRSARHSYFGRY